MTRKEISVLLLFALLCAVVALASPQFLSVANLRNVARLVGTYGIFSIGVGIVVITGGIDLSVGSICALLGILLSMGTSTNSTRLPPPLSAAAACAAAKAPCSAS
jgi:ribose transport system permease protein